MNIKLFIWWLNSDAVVTYETLYIFTSARRLIVGHVPLSVCLYLCIQDFSKGNEQILMDFFNVDRAGPNE